ncbi:MAG: hypothetical protein KatS3mg109_1902 [Pirellulaceae bacterium]|nr:MAG: hypothetical protein KatS3mg109_1902 [Pirellulaceae bacterium]
MGRHFRVLIAIVVSFVAGQLCLGLAESWFLARQEDPAAVRLLLDLRNEPNVPANDSARSTVQGDAAKSFGPDEAHGSSVPSHGDSSAR